MLGFYRVSGLGLRTCIGFLQGLGVFSVQDFGFNVSQVSQGSTDHKVHK